jgi:hypothetical protein
MIYPVGLKTVGIVVGLFLLVLHGVALWRSENGRRWLKEFPRSRAAGTVLILIAGIWSLILIRTMDLGEFARLRTVMSIAVVAGTFLAWRYMEEFLAVRALGMIALLAAEPLLSAAYLKPDPTRLLVVVLAYAWIVLGLFWVGVPWTLRDQISWLTARLARYQAAAWGGVIYGALVLVCAVIFWR